MGVRVAENLYGKYGVPSLDLVFTSPRARLKNVSGDSSLEVEFSRTQDTQASYVKSDGIIGYAATDVARFDHDPLTNESLGLLVEEARTNNVLRSDSISYATSSGSVTVNTTNTLAPDGTFTAVAYAPSQRPAGTTYHEHGLITPSIGSCPNGNIISIYAKMGPDPTLKYIHLRIFTGSYITTFNLEDGTFTENTPSTFPSTMTDVGNGWWRLTARNLTGSSTNLLRIYIGDNTSIVNTPTGDEIYLWGLQNETGSFPTSYIPTPATFTSRASEATYYDVNGNVAFAATDVAREPAYFPDSDGTMIPAGLLLEGEETNDNQYSEYHAQYSTTAAEVIENQALAPDLSWTASSLVETTDTDYHELLPYPTPSIGSTTRLTFSTFIKNKQGSKNALLRFNDGVDDVGMYFNPSSGSVVGVLTGAGTTTPSDYGSQKLNNDWYRIYVTADATVGTRETAIHIIDNTTYSTHAGTAGTDGFYLWGVQMEQSPFMSSYIESPASFTSRSQTNAESASFYQSNGIIGYAATDVARDDAYFPDENGVFYPAGLLIEDQATNLMTYSEDLNNWSSNTSMTVSTATTETNAPDGTQTADKITNAANETGLANTISSVTGTHTASIYVKYAGTTNWARIATGTGNPQVWFDINNGTVGTENNGAVGQIQSVSNGWYRCSMTADFSGLSFVGINPSTADGSTTEGNGNSLYVWGTQVEEGSYATSYIPTTSGISTRGADFSSSSATTRAADISSSNTSTRGADTASITGAGFSSFYNQNEGTVFSTFKSPVPEANTRYWLLITDGANSLTDGYRFEMLRILTSNAIGGNAWSSVADWLSTGYTQNAENRTAFGYDRINNFNSFVNNGTLQESNTSATDATVAPTTITIGASSAVNNFSGHISRLTYWPTRLPDSDLQSLTE
jgi:hypothetical protein